MGSIRSGREEMLELIDRIHRQLGILVVLSSHILDDVERVCDYVVVLDGGQVVASQPLHVPDDDTADLACARRRRSRSVSEASRGAGSGRHGRPGSSTRRMSSSSPVTATGSLDAIRDAAAMTGSPLRLLRPAKRSLEELYVDSVGAGANGARGRRRASKR